MGKKKGFDSAEDTVVQEKMGKRILHWKRMDKIFCGISTLDIETLCNKKNRTSFRRQNKQINMYYKYGMPRRTK